MWPFSVKKIGKRSIDEDRRPDLLQLIDRDHIYELDNNDAELRVWLPELCKQALDETVESGCTTAARYLRELLIVYLYGEHELRRMREKDTGIYYKPPTLPQSKEPESGIMFSRSPATEVVPGLGKNIAAVKIFLPTTIKDDLQKLADKAGIRLSTFVREILISHLLGHTLWQERLRAWSPDEEAVGVGWEEGKIESVYIRIEDGKRIDGKPESDPELHCYW